MNLCSAVDSVKNKLYLESLTWVDPRDWSTVSQSWHQQVLCLSFNITFELKLGKHEHQGLGNSERSVLIAVLWQTTTGLAWMTHCKQVPFFFFFFWLFLSRKFLFATSFNLIKVGCARRPVKVRQCKHVTRPPTRTLTKRDLRTSRLNATLTETMRIKARGPTPRALYVGSDDALMLSSKNNTPLSSLH